MKNIKDQQSFDGVSNTKLKPLIKWAGGKTRLNPILIKAAELALKSLHTEKLDYYEPFFGGGALFFELHNNEKIDKGHINDIIPHLISFYETVADDKLLNQLLEKIEQLANEFNEGDQKEIYGSAKENTGWVGDFNKLWMIDDADVKNGDDNEDQEYTIKDQLQTKHDKIQSAALFYVLNKTGFNGMFRLSQKGKFNIPKGDTNKIRLNDDDFKKNKSKESLSVKEYFQNASSILKNTSITCGSYEKLLPPVNEIDKSRSFIYLDPPYYSDSENSGFTDYSREGFEKSDHQKIANIFNQLVEDGYKVVLSNNSNTGSKKMYAENKNIFAYEVDVSRSIAKTEKGKRLPSKELLVSSFNLDDLHLEKIELNK